MKYRPSDEEMEESILLLTQRSSHPNSPCLDLNGELETRSILNKKYWLYSPILNGTHLQRL
ncbi:unnamed protein product, partial [Candidula unifasciata]